MTSTIELGGNAPGYLCVTKLVPIRRRPKDSPQPPKPKAKEKPKRERVSLAQQRASWPSGYYSLSEAAKKWGWSRNALASALMRDSLKALKVGNWWIVNDQIMLEYKARCEASRRWGPK